MNTSIDYYFLKILEEQPVVAWKASDFWAALLVYGVKRDIKNRQRLYQLLRKYSNQHVLFKTINPYSQRLSTFTVIDKLNNDRQIMIFENQNCKIIQERIKETEFTIRKLHIEIRMADKVIKDFPFISNEVQAKKKTLQLEFDELTAYMSFLNKWRIQEV